jgi:hypothetical protein
MIQPIRKLILLLPLLFAGALATIHAQPHDDETLRAFLDDADCSASCLMSIQPGRTDFMEVSGILEAHPWVSEYRYTRGMAQNAYFFTWWWSGAQPDYIDNRVAGKLWIERRRVKWIEVATRFSFGDLWLIQRPEHARFSLMSVEPRRVLHEAGYGQINVYTEVVCPLQPTSFWVAPAVFRVERVGADSLDTPYALPDWQACS